MEELINNWLKLHGGLNPYGEPLYRLVWSDSQIERRWGTFNDFTPSGIFVRTFTGFRDVKKYPWIHERWLVERWCEPDLMIANEIDISRGTYEPVFVYEDKNGNPLPLALFTVQFIIAAANADRTTPEVVKDLRERAEKAEIAELLERIHD